MRNHLKTVGIASAAVVAVVVPLLYSYICGGQMSLYFSPSYKFKDIPDLTGKVAIVTGSNTGIGYITARELARKGAKVIVAARSVERGTDAVRRIKLEIGNVPGAHLLELIKLDLSSFAEVQQFSKDFSEKGIPLNILILNAAAQGQPYSLTADGLETTIGVNHFGHFLLVKLLSPIMMLSHARIVTISSLAHALVDGVNFDSFTSNVGYEPFQAYGQSKLCNILFSNDLARRFNGTGVTSNSLHPGIIKDTEIDRYGVATRKASKYWFLLEMQEALFSSVRMGVADGALTQLYVATSPQLEGVTGQYFSPVGVKSWTSAHVKNETVREKLWEVSERLTKPFW